MMSGKKLFISHASKDKPLADAFVDLLDTGIRLPRDEIFCTSLEDLGIPSGQNFIDLIKQTIQNPSQVILMLSENYYDSVFCLCEMGAAWGLSLPIFPIVVPPLEVSSIKAIWTGTQLGKIDDSAYLDSLRDLIIKSHNISHSPTPTWSVKSDQFLKRLESILQSLPKSNKVSPQIHTELQQKYDASIDELSKAETKLKQLEAIIEGLKNLKDATQVQEVIAEHSDENEEFDQSVKTAQEAGLELAEVVVIASYFEFRGEPLPFSKRKDIRIAIEDGFLSQDGEGIPYPNKMDRKVKTFTEAIEGLDGFLRAASREFKQRFHDKYGYEPEISNRRFWKDILLVNMDLF